jgi:hypothetical protein
MSSDTLGDEVEGRVYGHRLAITFSTSGGFRDLELLPGTASTASPEDRTTFTVTDDAISVWVPDAVEPAIEEDPNGGAVTIRLQSVSPDRWAKLQGSGVLLGIREEDVLVAIRVEPEIDPLGEREAEWLDSLGA